MSIVEQDTIEQLQADIKGAWVALSDYTMCIGNSTDMQKLQMYYAVLHKAILECEYMYKV